VVDLELERFKREVSLVSYAVERWGYVRDRRESGRASHVLRHPVGDDKLVVRQSEGGHWVYFSVRDERDHGTIVDFLQRRGTRSLGAVRQELRAWLGSPRPEREEWGSAPERAGVRRSAAEAFAAARVVEQCPYLQARGLRTETLSDARFAGTWRVDGRGNVLFAHTDDGGAVTGFEVKNRDFTGFAAGGSKSAWRSAVREGDRELVVAESAIDALSFRQLYPRADARYWSTAGWPSARQGEQLVRALEGLPRGGRLVLATDADAAGERLAQKLGELTRGRPDVVVERAAPSRGKDWNEVLQRVERDAIRALPAEVRALGAARGRER
jgi:hypothetical protein